MAEETRPSAEKKSDEQSRDDGPPRGGRRGGGKFSRFGRRRKLQRPEEPLEYKNVEYLSNFILPTGKIKSRRSTGFSGQDQRKLANAIKLARFIGLMPFTGVATGDGRR